MERKFNKTESSSPQLPDQLVKLLWKIGQSRSVHQFLCYSLKKKPQRIRLNACVNACVNKLLFQAFKSSLVVLLVMSPHLLLQVPSLLGI